MPTLSPLEGLPVIVSERPSAAPPDRLPRVPARAAALEARRRPLGRWLALRNLSATLAGDSLSIETALFISWIAGIVKSALTLLSVSSKAGPSCSRTFLLRRGATFWKPKTCLGSSSNLNLPPTAARRS